ncbi:MAG TPA: cytidine deaminase [Bacteroidales bacterium]|nr:cytidine deaminase [Bacteroidales bacterium]
MPEKKIVSFSLYEYKNPEEINPQDRELIKEAETASVHAYAPYSKFFVGAAVRLSNGQIVTGSNVENAAYPAGICAERNAIAYAVSNHPSEHVIAIAVVAANEKGITAEPASPCGMCRQVLAEEEYRSGGKIRVILSGEKKTLVIESISDLLPIQFSRDNLDPILP